MKDEIKEILDRLERIDHKEYSGGFEFADTSCFDEVARCFEERKKMANYITNLQQEFKEANESTEWWTNRFKAVEKENEHLRTELNAYENPDDLTLFYMWLDEKAKDKMKKLQQRIEKAISILNKRKEDTEDFAWVEMRKNSYYEECDEVINILQGDSND